MTTKYKIYFVCILFWEDMIKTNKNEFNQINLLKSQIWLELRTIIHLKKIRA